MYNVLLFGKPRVQKSTHRLAILVEMMMMIVIIIIIQYNNNNNKYKISTCLVATIFEALLEYHFHSDHK